MNEPLTTNVVLLNPPEARQSSAGDLMATPRAVRSPTSALKTLTSALRTTMRELRTLMSALTTTASALGTMASALAAPARAFRTLTRAVTTMTRAPRASNPAAKARHLVRAVCGQTGAATFAALAAAFAGPPTGRRRGMKFLMDNFLRRAQARIHET